MARLGFLLAAVGFVSAGLSDYLLQRWDWVALDGFALVFAVYCAAICWRDA